MANPVTLIVPPHAPTIASKGWTMPLGRFLLRCFNWRLTGAFPEQKKVLFIAAPHTSNWDWVIGVCALLASGLKITYLAKHSLFVWPLSLLMRGTGAVPVDRSNAAGTVDTVVKEFSEHESLYYGLAPEGTRSNVGRWKTGFLRIVYAADVCLVPVSFDYDKKCIDVAAPIETTGDLDQDLAAVTDFYKRVKGRNSPRS